MEAAENWTRWNGDFRAAPRNLTHCAAVKHVHLIYRMERSLSMVSSHYSDIWVQVALSRCNFVLKANSKLVCNRLPWSIWQNSLEKKRYSNRQIGRMETEKQWLEGKNMWSIYVDPNIWAEMKSEYWSTNILIKKL